ncbi:MAG: SDR family NAD(P)-dependent oxidoreductase [Pirellulaceae bacterium]
MSDPLFSVADQIVIISGGSRGIGKAIAQGFAVRGAHTVVTGRETDSLHTTVSEITEAGVYPRSHSCRL